MTRTMQPSNRRIASLSHPETRYHLLVAFTVGEWIYEMQKASLLDVRHWPPREIRAEYDRELIVTTTRAE